ncbi:major sperm protein [Anaeramoeba flamelloides]|uniref:Major sperm protein n=1 Tax=Anaeramoeba flamelloides TaxID=1746091 RepID=A0ABQ8YHP1_9EUKA|nr:major sperm protein [Anaeramoeba flamelloides]
MGNEICSSVSRRKIKKYLKLVKKQRNFIAIIDTNLCWLTANPSLLKFLKLEKSKQLTALTIDDLFPVVQKRTKKKTFEILVSSLQQLKSLVNNEVIRLTLEYNNLQGETGLAIFAFSLVEINRIELIQILVTPIENLETKNTNSKDKTTLDFSNSTSSNIESNENELDKQKSENQTEKIEKKKKKEEEPKTDEEQDKEKTKKIKKNETEKQKETETETEKEPKTKTETEKETGKEIEKETEKETTINIQKQKVIKTKSYIEENLEEIELIITTTKDNLIEKFELQKYLVDRVTKDFDDILKIHQKILNEKKEKTKKLSQELLDLRKSIKNKFGVIEAKMHRMLAELEKEKKTKREVFDKNLLIRRSLKNIKSQLQLLSRHKEEISQFPNILTLYKQLYDLLEID